MKYTYNILLLSLIHIIPSLCDASTQSKQQQQQYSTRATARRERNLDHWDADTLVYYLGIDETTGKVSPDHEYPGYDTAVMFYAQWCQNCHAFAPTWDAIATHVHAGTQVSNLIMALFDCELDTRHSKLCSMAGVQHYPTLMFIGDGTFHDSDVVTRTILGKKRSSGPAGPSPIAHTVKFQGQWQYADSVLDWLRLMQGFSRWHRWASQGFLRHVRNGLLGFFRPQRLVKKKPTSLPVGLPTATTSGSTASSYSSMPVNTQATALLERKLNQSQQETKLMEKAAAHAGLLLDAILFPPKYQNATSDVYEVMNTTDAWEESDNKDMVKQVVRTCNLELSLDYCSRLSSQVTSEYLQEMENMTDFPSMTVIEALLKERISSREPYCGIMDDCFTENFVSDKCRPAKCPFQDAGCRYVSACLDPTIQREYAVALGLITEDEKDFPPKETAPKSSTTETKSKKKEGSWGF